MPSENKSPLPCHRTAGSDTWLILSTNSIRSAPMTKLAAAFFGCNIYLYSQAFFPLPQSPPRSIARCLRPSASSPTFWLESLLLLPPRTLASDLGNSLHTRIAANRYRRFGGPTSRGCLPAASLPPSPSPAHS